MARYEYRCKVCDERFELRRPMSDADEPAACSAGHPEVVRLLSVFASVGAASPSGSPSMPTAPLGGCGARCACSPG
jgi:putative FmdB family regulatory protein